MNEYMGEPKLLESMNSDPWFRELHSKILKIYVCSESSGSLDL